MLFFTAPLGGLLMLEFLLRERACSTLAPSPGELTLLGALAPLGGRDASTSRELARTSCGEAPAAAGGQKASREFARKNGGRAPATAGWDTSISDGRALGRRSWDGLRSAPLGALLAFGALPAMAPTWSLDL
mmetsp:Transcript_127232/g.234126  ORF Transcript_127232/g.234126 Transcript_127232/m.234126 type:complete len:132 (+) Transcript_127232:280-675(+)